ncbi:MAG: HEAT repeat domain-containing protein [Planctomycetales bacterium]|nr:HEAT repeat domain-containing protein [Planctomycetales bacterium]
MTSALETTFDVLSTSRNESAVPALINALDCNDGHVYEGAIQALVARRNKAGHLAVLARWHILSASQRELVLEGRGRMSGALRDAVLADDSQLFENACELVVKFTEFDLVPTLVTLAENKISEHAKAATELVAKLTSQLSEIVYGPRDPHDRRDPNSIRRYVLESLERSVERFRCHGRSELIEAFVILAGPSCGLLKKILDDPHHPCYNTVVGTLANSRSAGVAQLLMDFLQRESTSLSVLNLISRRADPPFVARLLASTDDKSFPKVAKNLGRIRSFSWLQFDSPTIDSFEEQDQARCIKLITASGMNPDAILDILERALIHGNPAGRYAACEALAEFPGDRPSQLILRAVRDLDPEVQASATRHLRDRHLPGTMSTLLKLIDSPHEIVREASREALSEFSFQNYLSRFETLSDDARRSTGIVVRKVDTETIPSLLAEMENKSRKARMRAIEIAETMQLVPQLCEGLIGLLSDEDHLVRAAAADALQLCKTQEVLEALQHATTDSSAAVQNAAKSSLATFNSIPNGFATGIATSVEAQL